MHWMGFCARAVDIKEAAYKRAYPCVLYALNGSIVRVVHHRQRLHVGEVPEPNGAVKGDRGQHVILQQHKAGHPCFVVL
jgi:hypothetical protein